MTLQEIIKKEPELGCLFMEARDFMSTPRSSVERSRFWSDLRLGQKQRRGTKYKMWKLVGFYREKDDDKMLCSCDAYDLVYQEFIKLLKI